MNQAQAIMAGFDLSDLDSEYKQVTFNVDVIVNADGDAVSGLIIVGKNSPEYQDVANKVRQENIMRAGKRGKQIDTSTEDGAAVVARTVAANEKTFAMAVVVGWYGFVDKTGPVEFDKEILEKMFKKFPQWQVKVNAALENDANFMKV